MHKSDSYNSPSSKRVNVTKTFLPKVADFMTYVRKIFSSKTITNQGPLLKELEKRLMTYLMVENLHFLTNGTLALQLALSSLDIADGEIITTPFSYVATISSILWQRCTPIFVDIEQKNFTIDPTQIEQAITADTKAIMAVHVFGYACDVEKLQSIANKHNLKLIYDGAHAFGSFYNSRSLASYGDISTLSFHATKLFHTIEGGACIVRDKHISDKLDLQKRFGHNYDEHFLVGINAKASEFQAAMGLANFPHIDNIIAERKKISELYDLELSNCLRRPEQQQGLRYNYAYYPIIFDSEQILLETFKNLASINVYPRRYFYPSLNTLPYVTYVKCPVSEDISRRIACLPLFVGLSSSNVKKICKIIRKVCSRESANKNLSQLLRNSECVTI